MGKRIRRTQTRPKEGDGSPRILVPSTHLQSRDSRKNKKQKNKKKTPRVRLTWKEMLWGRSDETRRLALVLAHGVTFGKLLPLSLSYLSCTMGRHGKPHLTSVERSYEFEFLQYWLLGQAPPCLLLSHPRLPFPLRL